MKQYSKGKVIITKELFDSLKNDDKFISVVNLGRYFNALMSSLENYLHFEDYTTSLEARQKWASWFASMGYLHEGLNLFMQLEKQFSGDLIFANTIGKLLAEPDIKIFNSQLADIRSNTAFHFYENIIKKTMSKFDLDEYVFMSFDSDKAGDMHFELSDDVNLNYILKYFEAGDNKMDEFGEFLIKCSGTIHRLSNSIHEFIWAYMNDIVTESPLGHGIKIIEK